MSKNIELVTKFCILSCLTLVYALATLPLYSQEAAPPKIGNFALRTSQQPSGHFGFGGNIIDKGDVQLFLFAEEFVGNRKVTSNLVPNVLFGITDDFSIQLNFPFSPYMQDGDEKSRGREDFFMQFEYAFYNKSTSTYVNQATVVTHFTTPTGSARKNPPTGFGSPSFFIGGTYYHFRVNWFAFVASGAMLTTSHRGTQISNQYLYQGGIGRNIPSPKGWIYAGLLELDGQYAGKNQFEYLLDVDSGGNIIFVTPSLWVSSEKFLLQFGVSFPVAQRTFGQQRKINYALNLNCAWTLY